MSAGYTVESPHSMPDLWALSDLQLQHACRMVAEGHAPVTFQFLRAEAMRLFLMWREAISEAAETGDAREEGACLLAALRKRTIQILVRISITAADFPGSIGWK